MRALTYQSPAERGLDIEETVDAVADLVALNLDAGMALRMTAEMLEEYPIAPELEERAGERDRYASQLAMLMARYGSGEDIPTSGTFAGKRFKWRTRIAAALAKDERQKVLEHAVDGSRSAEDVYKHALDTKALPADVRKVVVNQLRGTEELTRWLAERKDA